MMTIYVALVVVFTVMVIALCQNAHRMSEDEFKAFERRMMREALKRGSK